jgi:hypothetical protein
MDQTLLRMPSPASCKSPKAIPPLFTKDLTDTRSSTDDVFLNAAPSTAGSQLSPGAEAFTPGHYLTPSATPALAGAVGEWVPVGTDRGFGGVFHAAGPGLVSGHAGVVSNLLDGSVPDDAVAHYGQLLRQCEELQAFRDCVGLRQPPALAPLLKETQAMIARLEGMSITGSSGPLLHEVQVLEGVFSADEQRGRAVLISAVPTTFSELTIRTMFHVSPSESTTLLGF